jgi:hypothetical protein
VLPMDYCTINELLPLMDRYVVNELLYYRWIALADELVCLLYYRLIAVLLMDRCAAGGSLLCVNYCTVNELLPLMEYTADELLY